MGELITVFVAGLLSSAHCIGMCGGFAAAIGATDQPMLPLVGRQLIYSAGRLTTYAFLGACGGFAGLYLSRFNTQLVSAQQVFSVLAGVIMLAVGLSVLGLLRLPRAVSGGVSSLFAPLYRHFLNARSTGGFFLAGIANGFLPCGLVYAFLAMAVTKESVSLGMLVMLCFGAGTVPVMVLIGCGSKLLSRTTRLRVYRVAACFVILAGIRTIVRGIPSGDAPCHTPVETTTTPTAPISVG